MLHHLKHRIHRKARIEKTWCEAKNAAAAVSDGYGQNRDDIGPRQEDRAAVARSGKIRATK